MALGTETLASFAGPGVKIIPLTPVPSPIFVGVGVAYLKKTVSAAAKNFIAAARSASSMAPGAS